MPGSILGIYGKQRSGKTLMAYKIAKSLQQSYAISSPGKVLRVYTNLYCPEDKDFIYCNRMSELPLDLEPKIVLIDEIYNGCDAQDYRKLKDISIFINTIGKQNCLFIFTAIDPTMVYNRIRNQMNIVILAKGNQSHIHYKILNLNDLSQKDLYVEKNKALFHDVNYDTSFIPVDFDWSMNDWRDKLSNFYKQVYDMDVTFS